MSFLKKIFGTSCDFHKSAEEFSKNFESLYPLEWTCGPQNIINYWKWPVAKKVRPPLLYIEQLYFRLKQLINYPIPQLALVISATISSIGHPSVSMAGIDEGPDAFLVTDSKVIIGDSMSSVPDLNFQIKLYRHCLPSVTECPRAKKKAHEL
jgi:hypothetical protein